MIETPEFTYQASLIFKDGHHASYKVDDYTKEIYEDCFARRVILQDLVRSEMDDWGKWHDIGYISIDFSQVEHIVYRRLSPPRRGDRFERLIFGHPLR